MSAIDDYFRDWSESVAREFARHAPDPTSQDEPEVETSDE